MFLKGTVMNNAKVQNLESRPVHVPSTLDWVNGLLTCEWSQSTDQPPIFTTHKDGIMRGDTVMNCQKVYCR